MCPPSEVTPAAFSEVSADTLPSSARPTTGAVEPASSRPARGARTPRLIGTNSDPDQVFRRLKVAVVGTGSVGRPLAIHLARLMIDTLWLIDPARFKAESLLTQEIFPGEIGRPKATSTAEVCKQISPGTRILASDSQLEDLDLLALADCDVALLAADNLAAEVEAGQRCLHFGKPLIQASVHGASMTAQVRSFANLAAAGPCPVCGFGEAEWRHLNQQTRFSCEDGRSGQVIQRIQGPVTASFSFLCSLAASLALTRMTLSILDLGHDTADTLWEYCGFTHRTCVTPLQRNPHCPCEHVAWVMLPPPRALSACTLRELTRAAGIAPRSRRRLAAVTVGACEFVQAGQCNRCGLRQAVQRFLAPGEKAPPCRTCGYPLEPLPFVTHRQVPLELLASQADRPLHQLSSREPRWVVVQEGVRGVCFRRDDTPTESVLP